MSAAFTAFSAACCARNAACRGTPSFRSRMLWASRKCSSAYLRQRATSGRTSSFMGILSIDLSSLAERLPENGPLDPASALDLVRRRHDHVGRSTEVVQLIEHVARRCSLVIDRGKNDEQVDVAVPPHLAACVRPEHDDAERIER